MCECECECGCVNRPPSRDDSAGKAEMQGTTEELGAGATFRRENSLHVHCPYTLYPYTLYLLFKGLTQAVTGPAYFRFKHQRHGNA